MIRFATSMGTIVRTGPLRTSSRTRDASASARTSIAICIAVESNFDIRLRPNVE